MARKLRKFHIRLPVERARGEQLWEIEATSAAEALALYQAGEGACSCVYEELEVETVGEPEITEVSE